MYSNVKQLYFRGNERPPTDVANDPGVGGVLSMTHWQGRSRLNLDRWQDNSGDSKLLATLFNPVLIGQNGPVLVYEGMQRTRMSDGSVSTCFQQWRVEVLGLQPPAGAEPDPGRLRGR